ncbi:MAG TPA: CBS domain-containing protein, partial [Roseimicrobium sp.]|nr:CBS domain-containing protein [Roseimicrobium sp.]
MIGKLLLPELTDLVEKREFNRLREVLLEFPAVEVAEILGDMSAGDKAVLLRILPSQFATEVFDHLSLGDQEELVQALGNEQVARILNDLQPDDRTALLEELPPSVTQKLLDLLTPEERRIAVELLGYPKDSVGRLMTPRYVAIRNEWTVGEVLDFLKGQGKKRDTLNLMFVVGQNGLLINRVRLRDLVVAPLSMPVSELAEENTFALQATDDQETAVKAFRKYDVSVLPVVNAQGALLGAITVDDILDVAQQESTEDMQKLGGMEVMDEPYLKTGLVEMIRKRAGWLAV